MGIPFKGLMYETSCLVNGQHPTGDGRRQACSNMELNAAECLEAYGAAKGRMYCAKFIEDLIECKNARIRKMRAYIMYQERLKKIARGEIPWSQRWGQAYPYDSYVNGTFFP